jgi:hypothetical protein
MSNGMFDRLSMDIFSQMLYKRFDSTTLLSWWKIVTSFTRKLSIQEHSNGLNKGIQISPLYHLILLLLI